MSILVTASLLSSVSFYENANEDWRDRANEGLYNSLSRAPFEPTPEIQRGLDFEDLLYRLTRQGKTETVKCSPEFRKILRRIQGGDFQHVAKKNMKISGDDFLIYCKLDVKHPAEIQDIKTTNKWNRWSEDKYYNSAQHHLYCYATGLEKFTYLIAVFADPKQPNLITDYKEIVYNSPGMDYETAYVKDKIEHLVKLFADIPEWDELWRYTFSKYNKRPAKVDAK